MRKAAGGLFDVTFGFRRRCVSSLVAGYLSILPRAIKAFGIELLAAPARAPVVNQVSFRLITPVAC